MKNQLMPNKRFEFSNKDMDKFSTYLYGNYLVL